jgi:hypothetical protein
LIAIPPVLQTDPISGSGIQAQNTLKFPAGKQLPLPLLEPATSLNWLAATVAPVLFGKTSGAALTNAFFCKFL